MQIKEIFKEILKHEDKKGTKRRFKVSLHTIIELKFKIQGSRSFQEN